jgi:hypothetical protein
MATRRIRLAGVVALAAAAVALLPSAAKATISPTYAVSGVEYSATSTEGKFAGYANGSTGDRGFWNTDVVHQPLSASCLTTGCAIDPEGSMLLKTSRGDVVSGSFSGGSITLVRQAPGCGSQIFHVVGHLATNAGAAEFDVALTHYRVFLGGCVSIFATIGPDQVDGIPGTLSF